MKSPRNPALDLTKGVLVLIMVLYHWLNDFVDAPEAVYRYLRFLTPSFIFITGFLIAQVYLRRGREVAGRVFGRGVRLLLVYGALNLALALLLGNGAGELSVSETAAAYLGGSTEVPGKAAFTVLAPISYLLLLAAALLSLPAHYSSLLPTFGACGWLGVWLLESQGVSNTYLELMGIGLAGIWVGHFPWAVIERVVSHVLPMLLIYAGYLWAVSLWDVAFVLQVLGVCVSVALIYWGCARMPEAGGLRTVTELLGRYSLFAYIAQIGILRVTAGVLRYLGVSAAAAPIGLVAGLCLTVLSVQVMDRMRRGMPAVNKVYGAVFS